MSAIVIFGKYKCGCSVLADKDRAVYKGKHKTVPTFKCPRCGGTIYLIS